MLGPEVKHGLPGCTASAWAFNGHQAEGGQGLGGFVVFRWGVGGGRRVIVVGSGGEFTAGEEPRRLLQFFALPLTPQASK